MKKITLIQILLLSFFFNVEAQNFIVTNNDTLNYTDSNNKKQGFWIYEDKRSEGNYIDDEKNGIWKSYYKNGNIKSEVTYINGKKRGYAKIFYEDGQIAEEGTWMEDKWTGKYKSYYRNGKLSYVWNYSENGNRSGYQKYYYENGNIKIEGEWNEGKESGIIKEYYSSGVLKSKRIFNDGKCDISKVEIFNEKDSVIDDKNFSTKKDTSLIIVDNNIKDEVKIKKENVVKKNLTDSIKTFTGNGNHILYDKNRNPEKEGEFSDGVLINGKQYFYDENNTLIKTAIYKSGKLVEIILN